MEPKLVRLSELQPYPLNPKGHDLGSIHTSILAHGFLERIVVNETTGHILSGHGRVETLLQQQAQQMDPPANIVAQNGDWYVPVDYVQVPEANEGAAVIALNRTVELGGWDEHKLAALLQDVQANAAVALESTGYDADDLYELLRSLTPITSTDDPGPQLDRAAELQQQWQVCLGDVWVIPSRSGQGAHRVLCGDSTVAADVDRLMGGVKAQLVVTDPPYGVGYADKNKFLNEISRGNLIQTPIENDHLSKKDMQSLWGMAFKNTNKVMSPGAAIYCFMPQGGDQMMMMMMMMEGGIEPRHELIWVKNNHVLGRVDYAYQHEPILYAWKEGGHKFYGGFQTSIIHVDKSLKSDLHPTTKPIELISLLITNSSVVGEYVFDPFLGSGTTIVACEQTGRIGYGMEIDPKYVAVTLERLKGIGLTPRRTNGAPDETD